MGEVLLFSRQRMLATFAIVGVICALTLISVIAAARRPAITMSGWVTHAPPGVGETCRTAVARVSLGAAEPPELFACFEEGPVIASMLVRGQSVKLAFEGVPSRLNDRFRARIVSLSLASATEESEPSGSLTRAVVTIEQTSTDPAAQLSPGHKVAAKVAVQGFDLLGWRR